MAGLGNQGQLSQRQSRMTDWGWVRVDDSRPVGELSPDGKHMKRSLIRAGRTLTANHLQADAIL